MKIPVIPSTPHSITSDIRRLCRQIGHVEPPIFVDVAPRKDSGFRDCFKDVEKHVSENGGQIIYGWMLWEWPGILVEAEFHAVWQMHDSKFLDISAKEHNEKTILFARDPVRVFMEAPVNNIRLPVGKSPLIKELVSIYDRIFRLRQKAYTLNYPDPEIDRQWDALMQKSAKICRELSFSREAQRAYEKISRKQEPLTPHGNK